MLEEVYCLSLLARFEKPFVKSICLNTCFRFHISLRHEEDNAGLNDDQLTWQEDSFNRRLNLLKSH